MPQFSKLDMGELGTSGLRQFDGFLNEEWHPKLRGSYGVKVYREMTDNSPTIGAIRATIESLVRQVEWRIEAADEDQVSEDWATFVEECMQDMELTFDDFVSEVLSFLDYGWAYFEVVYKMRKGLTQDPQTTSRFDDGRIGWRKFALRSQDTLDRWQFSADKRSIEGMHQMDTYAGTYAYIPADKALHFRTKVYKDNPEGRSIFRNAVIPYIYLKRLAEIEAIGVERDMTGLLTMEVPTRMLSADASASDRALLSQLQTLLGQLKRDEREYAVVPSEVDEENKPTGYKLKLLSTGGRRQIDTSVIKKEYKIDILQSALAQFIQLGMGSVGSFALASSQTNIFSVALGAYMDTIAETFNKQAIGKLMQINGVPVEHWPYLVHGDIETPPLAEIGAYIQSLASTGQLPEDDAIKRKLLEYGKLPIPDFDAMDAMDAEEEEETEEEMNAFGGDQEKA